MNTNDTVVFASATVPTHAPADASANALTPTAPAAPAAAAPLMRATLQRCSFMRISVYRAGTAGGTTISMPASMYEKMLKFASGSHSAVTKACRTASLELSQHDGTTWSHAVRQRALQKLMGAYMPNRAPKLACNAVQK